MIKDKEEEETVSVVSFISDFWGFNNEIQFWLLISRISAIQMT
jgi:hypothetical protein